MNAQGPKYSRISIYVETYSDTTSGYSIRLAVIEISLLPINSLSSENIVNVYVDES